MWFSKFRYVLKVRRQRERKRERESTVEIGVEVKKCRQPERRIERAQK